MFESLVEAAYKALNEAAKAAESAGKFLSDFDGDISASVGLEGVNHPNDVMSVQIMLNVFIATDSRMQPLNSLTVGTPIVEVMQDDTITAIIWFQGHVLGFHKPDGLVLRNKNTHDALRGYKSKIPKPKAPIHDEITQMPLQLGPSAAQAYEFGGSVPFTVSYGKGVIYAGDTWMALDGQRVVHQASYSNVVYILLKPRGSVKPGVYIQKTDAFISDVNIVKVGSDIAQRCQYIRAMILVECEFLIGIGCALYVPGALFIMTMEIGPFVLDNYQKIPVWARLVGRLSIVVWTLEQTCPTLFHTVLRYALGRIIDYLPQALTQDSRKLARAAGGLVGNIGMKAFEASMGTLKIIGKILLDIVKFIVVTGVPASGKLNVAEGIKRVEQLKSMAQKVGVALEAGQAETILVELIASAGVLMPLIGDLQAELEKLDF